MKFRARAAAIIFNDNDELLMVLHKHPRTGEKWWTIPGGGLEIGECAKDAIVREVREESGIECVTENLVYVRELIDEDNDRHYIELFFTARAVSYDIYTGTDPELPVQYIQKTAFLSEKQIRELNVNVFPEVLRDRFWDDLKGGFAGHTVYLGQHRFIKK